MPKKFEAARYQLAGLGPFVDGDWSHYDIVPTDGRSVVGMVSRRSGGGWIATLPVFGKEDNGIALVNRRVGTAYGRGQTPAEALEEADRRAIQGVTGSDEFHQEGF